MPVAYLASGGNGTARTSAFHHFLDRSAAVARDVNAKGIDQQALSCFIIDKNASYDINRIYHIEHEIGDSVIKP